MCYKLIIEYLMGLKMMLSIRMLLLPQKLMAWMYCHALQLLFTALLLTYPALSHSKTSSQSLSKCLIENLTLEDRELLQVWSVMGLGKNPVMKGLILVDEELLRKMNVTVAETFERLMFDECSDALRAGIIARDRDFMGQSFHALGKHVMSELFLHQTNQSHSKAPIEVFDI